MAPDTRVQFGYADSLICGGKVEFDDGKYEVDDAMCRDAASAHDKQGESQNDRKRHLRLVQF